MIYQPDALPPSTAPPEGTLEAEADSIAIAVLELVRHRAGRLAAVTVLVPAAWLGSDLAARIRRRLEARGLPDVSVSLERGEHLRLSSVELDR